MVTKERHKLKICFTIKNRELNNYKYLLEFQFFDPSFNMRKSKYWSHFSKQGFNAQCNLCNITLKTCGNTSNIARHLKDVHPEQYFLLNETTDNTNGQPKITTSLSVISSFKDGDLKKKCDNKLSWWLIKNSLPFRTVESEYFKAFIANLNSHYKPPTRKKVVSIIEQIGERKMEVMKNHLKLIKWFCLTSDGWKDIMNQNSYLGLTIHYFDDYELQSFCLSVEVFNESMTSDAIFKRIEHVLNEWEIPLEKIVTIVTDGAANFQSAARRFGNNLHCCAHRLNLVVEDSLESELHVVNLITSVRNIVTIFKQSSKLMNELRVERQLAGKSDLKLLQDIVTRWNSVYIMIERYLELRDEISVVLLKNMRREEDIEYNQINELKEIIILLKPFYEMTLDLSGEKYVSISKIIPLIVSINTYLSKTRVECASTRSLKLNLLENVKQRFNSVQSDEALAFGTLLDPRFKKLAFQSSSAESIAVTKLNSLLYDIPTTQIVPCDDESDSLLWSIYDRKVRSLNDVSCGLNSGLKHYLELPVIDRHNDPMQFWKKYKENWPQLHNLALKYLTMQATSVPCERLFSKTGSLITEKRNRLKPKNVKLISFLDSLPANYI